MKVKDFIDILQTMPKDADFLYGYAESGHGKHGYTLFDPDDHEVLYKESVWSFGNNTPRPPGEHKHVVILDIT